MLNLGCHLPAKLEATVSSDQDIEVDTGADLLFKAYVPGIEIDDRFPLCPDLTIRHHETSEDQGLKGSKRDMILRDAWEGKISQDLYHLLYSATRVKLLEKGLYSVHAACAENKMDDGQILIVGHSGSGKTTTALELVQHRDWKLSSGNKTVVSFNKEGGIEVVAGTTTMTVRDGQSEGYASELGKEIEDYGGRIAFSLDESHYVSVSDRPLKAIVVVRLHDGLRDTHEMNPLSALHTLYPYFMDTVNADAIVAQGQGVYRGRAPKKSTKNLSTNLSSAVSEIPVYSVAGPLSYVVDTVASI